MDATYAYNILKLPYFISGPALAIPWLTTDFDLHGTWGAPKAMTTSRTLAVAILISCSAFAAACNSTNKKSEDAAVGAQQGQGSVAIQGRIDDGKTNTVTPTPGTTTPPITPAVAANATDANCYKADARICKIEAEILRLTNAERAAPTGLFRRKMEPLKAAPKMSWVARDWSVKQGRRANIGHDGFPNQRDSVFQSEFSGARAQIAAENVAMTGAGSEADVAQQFFDMWRHSPGHYANMMGNYAAMGVGVAQGSDGWYATEIFGDE